MDGLVKSIDKIADFATNGITKGVEILLKEAPQVASQFLTFKAFVFGFTALLLLGILIIMLVLTIKLINFLFKYKTENDDVKILIITIFSSAIITSNIYNNFIQFMYIKLAPKVFLIEFFSNLIKK